MPVYVIGHDLIAPGRNYPPRYDELTRLGAKRLAEHRLRLRPSAITFKGFVDANDRVLTTAVESPSRASLLARLGCHRFRVRNCAQQCNPARIRFI